MGGDLPDDGSHGICEMHATEMIRQQHERKMEQNHHDDEQQEDAVPREEVLAQC
jgi:hypothetical protein